MLLDEVDPTMELLEHSLRLGNSEDPPDSFFLDTLGISDLEKQGILELAANPVSQVDPVVSFMVGATNGIAYESVIGRLREYPIPHLRLPPGESRTFLDLGCNWGRWCFAAAKLGYEPIGIDPSLGAVMAAKRSAEKLGLSARFIVGDARHLPIRADSIDQVFSYSVIQHFSREDAACAISEVGRVLKPGGSSLIQMPNRLGIRCLQHQARRRFREAQGFEVRYWSLRTLRELFETRIGSTEVSVDCFFGIGLQASDYELYPPLLKRAIKVSEVLRKTSHDLPVLKTFADSVYLSSRTAER